MGHVLLRRVRQRQPARRLEGPQAGGHHQGLRQHPRHADGVRAEADRGQLAQARTRRGQGQLHAVPATAPELRRSP